MPSIITEKHRKTEDLTGKTFSHYEVVRFAGYFVEDNRSTKKRAHWLCRCTRCHRESELSIRELRGKYKGGKEVPHKRHICLCELERKLFNKVNTRIQITHDPCVFCGTRDSISYDEAGVYIKYNVVNPQGQVCCEKHIAI